MFPDGIEGVVVQLIRRFDIHLDPTQSFDIEETGILRLRDGTGVTLTLREPTA